MRSIKYLLKMMLMVLSITLSTGISTVWGQSVYSNPDTGYLVEIDDRGGLLTEAEIKSLTEIMIKITEYGNAVFYTEDGDLNAGQACEDYYLDRFGAYNSGVMFYIDPDELYIYSEGDIYDVLGDRWARTITDNVYSYCYPGTFLQCCVDTYTQILNVLEGKRVPQPMKYICNIILGLFMGFFICYMMVERRSTLSATPDRELIKATRRSCELMDANSTMVSRTKTYSPRSSGGSGGGGRGGGGHSGGGGGHSR